jgi:murein DD-endopeptidase MepM/ murein hydrolase activator NlpD
MRLAAGLRTLLLRVARHDATLVALVAAFAVVSVGVLTAERPAQHPAASDSARSASAEVASPGPVAPAATAPAPAAREVRLVEAVLASGATLEGSLRRQGVSREIVRQISRELSAHFDFRLAQPGHAYRLTLTPQGDFVEFRYAISSLEGWRMSRKGGRFEVRHEEASLTAEVARVAGVVTTTLHDAIAELGESPQLASDFADIFAWDIDFSRSTRYGDDFGILYERLYRSDWDGNEVYVGPGRILAARYQGSTGDLRAVYFEVEEGRGGYYRPDGSSVEGIFLRAPLRYSRISSRFSSARRHPILRVTRPHQGIDYAAPAGTPLWAVADGKVIYRGRAGGFGNLVKIRHRSGYVSYYAHLSSFAKGLRVGQTVRQKQVIGFVGQTGLATGPHVCFRIAKDGEYVDPARLHAPSGPPLSPDLEPRFFSARDMLFAALDAGPPVIAVEEAL